MSKLIIVESPTKAKTISRFLGSDFVIEPSNGHVRDLPKSRLGVDINNSFEPEYITIVKARKRVNELKKKAISADKIILATDEDREGEAIAWHLVQALSLGEVKNVQRIVFHEITEKAILDALKNPREIKIDLVNAQQARRILDRLVGYELSPFLWKKIMRGLSAGRVQSVAVRLVVEREREIQSFKPEEYHTISALLRKLNTPNLKSQIPNTIEANLIKIGEKTLAKLDIKNKKEADDILRELEKAEYEIINIDKKETKRNSPSPFITSTLQQTAWQRLHFSAKQTMMFAQELYEKGFITYMRTDSLNLSEESLVLAEKFIKSNLGAEYSETHRFKTKSKIAQEAHEAVRPVDPAIEDLPSIFKKESAKLYDVIRRRFIASQMKPLVLDATSVDIKAKNCIFRVNGSIVKFDGFTKIYPINLEEKILPELKIGEKLNLEKLISEEHFTEPPPRYNEASLIKALEKFGIGRPSTYAPIMSTIQERNYVEKNDQKKFIPTEIGLRVNDLLVEHFPEVVDIGFTSKMEDNLDDIADGKKEWRSVMQEFHEPFLKNLKIKYEEVEKQKPIEEKTDEICEKCGKPMMVKFGRFGKFLACSGFPDCKNTKSLIVSLGKCPKCKEGEIVEKRTHKKRIFFGCSRYPKCDFATWQKPGNNENKEAAN